ncbi:hypothetical protein MUK42_19843 [Musa troglodytarum]|uniref:Uncharacterized protein n=1 Tax=Musa troglodytarum TaxID=320322 RepID=A0A9E7ELR9_9LILI|nr:hypothetical protein MUK42_19843 [Musa troglodytarum]
MTDTYGLLLTAGNLQDSSPGTRIHPNHSLAELVVGPARPRASELAIAVGMTRVKTAGSVKVAETKVDLSRFRRIGGYHSFRGRSFSVLAVLRNTNVQEKRR